MTKLLPLLRDHLRLVIVLYEPHEDIGKIAQICFNWNIVYPGQQRFVVPLNIRR